MMSVRRLQSSRECGGGCTARVKPGLCGHDGGEPFCQTCFAIVAPELAGLVDPNRRAASTIWFLDRGDFCTNCEDIIPAGYIGHHFGDPMCQSCFGERAGELGALLRIVGLVEPALEGADIRKPLREFCDLMSRLQTAKKRLREDR